MKNRIKILSFCICTGLMSCQSLFAQEDLLKEFAEMRNERKLAFYPSTLRMINLGNNTEFNAVVNDIEKLLVYVMDSATTAQKSYFRISEAYLNAGFDEYVSASGGDLAFTLLGKEHPDSNEFAGYFSYNDSMIAFYLTGRIPFDKIYMLTQTMRQEDFLNPLNLTKK